jgi:hypothetical protein
MAKESFDVDLVLDTDEALQNFIDAIEAADARGPLELPDFSDALKKGKELVEKGCPFS